MDSRGGAVGVRVYSLRVKDLTFRVEGLAPFSTLLTEPRNGNGNQLNPEPST